MNLLPHQRGQIVFSVEVESEDQLHAISKRLQQAIFVGRGQEQREVGNRDALRRIARPSTLEDDLATVEGEVQGSLKRLVKLMGLIYVANAFVGQRQEQAVQGTRPF